VLQLRACIQSYEMCMCENMYVVEVLCAIKHMCVKQLVF
jgi:hypothetical protein